VSSVNSSREKIMKPAEALRAYKAYLRDLIDQRPSGTRKRIAEALGTHRSFISQVLNPSLKVPLPSQHIAEIFSICHFSPEEKKRFLELYQQAHPDRQVRFSDVQAEKQHVIRIIVPPFRSARKRAEVERLIREFAARIIALAKDD